MTTLYIARHGTSTWNAKKIIQGHKNSPLAEKGILQAKELAKKFKDIKFDLIFSSDLLRAKKTAEIVALEHDLAVQTTKFLRERHYGHLEGKSQKHFKKWDEALEKLTDAEKLIYKHSPEMESDEEISDRMLTFLREVVIGNPGKTILFVSHGATMRATLIKLGLGDYNVLNHGTINNCGYVKLQTNGVDFSIKEVSGISVNNQNAE